MRTRLSVGVLLWIWLMCADGGRQGVGVDYGQLGDDLPSPAESVGLIQKLRAESVKIYDTNPRILKALAHTGIKLSVMVKNEDIANVSGSQSLADDWVERNVGSFYPATRINIVLVGNEILSDYSHNQTWFQLVPAMRRIRRALVRFGLRKIKVGTPHAMDVLGSSFPPSSGSFRADVAETVMKPMLRFLNRTRSFFFVDVYPYFAWAADPARIPLEYALFGDPAQNYTDPNGLLYTNLLDQQLDAVVGAMSRLGYGDIRLAIAETGWPNAGDLNQAGANVFNAARYNRRLVRKMVACPGTPRRPGQSIPTYIFSLYNENRKPGPGTERHWGLLYPNGTSVYEIDLAGKLEDSEYPPLPPPPPPYTGKLWCVVDAKANVSALPGAIAYACGQGNDTCLGIQPGEPCYEPNSLVSHASYAFDSYWQRFKASGATCYFDGAATLVKVDPSYGSCKYPSA